MANLMKDQPRPGYAPQNHNRTGSIDRSGSYGGGGPPPLPQKDLPSIPQIEVFKRKGSLNRRQGSIDSTVSFGSNSSGGAGGGGMRGVDVGKSGALPTPPRLSTVMAEAQEMLMDDSESFTSGTEEEVRPARRW